MDARREQILDLLQTFSDEEMPSDLRLATFRESDCDSVPSYIEYVEANGWEDASNDWHQCACDLASEFESDIQNLKAQLSEMGFAGCYDYDE